MSSAKIVPHLLNSMFVAEDDAATFVAAGDDLVEETGPVEAHGRVAELVEDDQVGTGEVPEQAVEGAVAFGLAELEHELRGVFCQVGVGRFGVSFSPCERRVSGRFGVGRSCWLLVIALVIA